MVILARQSTLVSAQNLSFAIKDLCNKDLDVRTEKVKEPIFIRWGNRSLHNVTDFSPNTPEFIRIMSNKYTSSEFLKLLGFPVVEFFDYKKIPTQFPVFIRKTLIGSKGRGIVVANTLDEFLNTMKTCYYWSYGIPGTEEFRIHYFLGKVIKIQKKERIDGKDRIFEVRTSKNYKYSETKPENYPYLIDLLHKVESSAILRSYFFSLDILYDEDYHKPVILESNTAPGLSLETARCYAKSFKKFFGW